MKPVCVVSCPIDTFSGYGARSRDFVRALLKSKKEEWDIHIFPQRWGECPWGYLDENDPLKKLYSNAANLKNKQPEIWIQITIPSEFQSVGKFNIGVTAGIESTIYPPNFIEGFNRMNLNLVSSTHSKNVALASIFEKRDNNTNQVVGKIELNKPVEVLFEGLHLDKYFKNSKKSNILKDIKEDFCFLYTGHWLNGKLGEDRKNTGLMIKTFLETFNTPSNKKPALILKTNMTTYSILDREEIIKKINKIKNKVKGTLPNIYLLHGEMTDEEMNQLNNDPKVKAFVSFTKGEGFGRPLLEGAITGKPVIVSNWSGHTDFIKPDYSILIGGELKPIHKSAANEWLMKESQWFNINTEIASKALKDVFKHYKKYWESSRKQTQYIKDNWTFDVMVEKLSSLLPKVEAAPQMQSLKLPKLKKLEDKKPKLPKLKLPKLKKIEA
jgi:glycosyltransferase involved in cell wall biosynthesis